MQNISITQLKNTFPGTAMVDYGDEFFICDLSYPEGQELTLMYPCRFDGSVSLFVLEGELSLSIGIDEYTATKGNLAISLPGDIIRLERRKGYQGPLRFHVMAIAGHILSEPEIQIHGLVHALKNRMIRTEGPYRSMVKHFREIIFDLTQNPHSMTHRSFRCLIIAMLIEIRHVWEEYSTEPDNRQIGKSRMVSSFLYLVSKDNCKHKNVSYFAEKMGLTPKYLSATIKAESGKSAIEWISEYIILEAKNQLKYTTLPVKEIAFGLGFESQMNFYRYFQRKTGMTPTEYRKN